MKTLHLALVFLAVSVAALAGPLNVTFSPTVEVYPPGAGATLCEINGTGPFCVVFMGTITDPDTDNSLLFLSFLSVNLDPTFFTVDNTFFNDVPGVLSGDPTYATDNSGNPPNAYTGPIFGLDIAPGTLPGVYGGTATFSVSGGSSDPNGNGFTVDQSFTVVVNPEPVTSILVLAGLLAICTRARRLPQW